MKKIMKMFKMLLMLFFGYLVFLTGQTTAETIKIQIEINKFIKKADPNPVIILNEGGEVIKFYKVSRETYYPNELIRDPFFNNDYLKPGAEGDIFVTREAPLPNLAGIYEFVSFYFGGHAVYIGEENSIYETFGFINDDENLIDVIINGGEGTIVEKQEDNYWLDPEYRSEDNYGYHRFGSFYRKEWLGLRVRNIKEEEIKQTTKFMDHLVEVKAQYNHLFIFATKYKYYCTDMISRGFATITNSNGESVYNLNLDGVVTTVNDLILSNDTYISYYVKTDKDGVKHVYFIG